MSFRFIAVVGLACCVSSVGAVSGHRSIKSLLSNQGFSGELTGKVALTTLGSLTCGPRRLQVIYYEWTEKNPPGEAIHASHRLIFLDGRRYIGSYSVDDRPVSVGPERIVFDYSTKIGNSLQCGAAGLPTTVVLDGDEHTLEK